VDNVEPGPFGLKEVGWRLAALGEREHRAGVSIGAGRSGPARHDND
jgi:hypothetical protein